jgi:UDPglucose 6-dehydrogenase
MAADLQYVELCARQIAKIATTDKIVVEKSTLPVKTAEAIKDILDNTGNGIHFEILSNPEFLAEGTAIQDLQSPDRVLIGGEPTAAGQEAIEALVNIYASWIPRDQIITTNLWSSELSKLTANAFLAQRVSSINALTELCEKTGASIDEVANAIGTDSRIGPKFLKASVGFGGSCFQKDILNLVYICKSLGLNEAAHYWEQVILMNNHQRTRFARNIVKSLYGTVADKKITFFGWAFKKDTNDTRESAAIYIADKLIEEKAKVAAYDPKVSPLQMQSDLNYLNSRSESENAQYLTSHQDPYKAADGAHALAIITEWDEFKSYDWTTIYQHMIKPAYIFDGRNLLDKSDMEAIGFTYVGIGQ